MAAYNRTMHDSVNMPVPSKIKKRRTGKLLTASILALLAVMIFPVLYIGAGRGEPGGSFLWPVDLPRQLSGTLGEVRGYSLHSGIDIKTRGRNGFPVMAAAGGRVYRVLSKETGYGNAVFLAHDDGLMSVYGHLDSFENDHHHLDSLVSVLKMLYNSDSLDFTFRRSVLLYRKGDRVAYSGESGTGTPHLHYEIRQGNAFINPLRMIRVEDTEAPAIDAVYVCSEENGTTVSERRIAVKKGWGGYRPEQAEMRLASAGRVFLKLSCFDRVNALNSVAVQRIVLRENSAKIFEIGFGEIKDSDFRYGHRIYDISKSTIDGTVTYTYFLCRRGNGGVSGMSDVKGGYITPDNKTRTMTAEVYDLAGNKSEVTFRLVPAPGPAETPVIRLAGGRPNTACDSANRFSMRTGPRALEGDMLMKIEELPADRLKEISRAASVDKGDIIALYAVRPFDELFEKPVEVSIKCAASLNGADTRRISIYQFFEGKKPKPLASKYNAAQGRFEAQSRVNGYFALLRDVKPPDIIMPPTHEFIEAGAVFIKLRLFILDSLSELNTSSVECFIDGEPYPAKYDMDRKWIELKLPRRAVAGRMHHVMVMCADNAGNKAVYRNLVDL